MTKAFGTVVKIGAANPPTTTLDGVFDVSPPNMTREANDVTDHASPGGAMEFEPDGVYDPGELVISMNYTKASATDAACRTAFLSGAMQYVQWTENAASGSDTLQAAGVVTSYQVDPLPVKGKQTAKLTIKLSGEIDEDAGA